MDPFFDKLNELNAEALRMVNTDRQQDYGHPTKNFANIAAGWSILFGVPISAHQVAVGMVWVKACRTIASPDKADTFLDMIGYSTLAGALALATDIEVGHDTDGAQADYETSQAERVAWREQTGEGFKC